MYDEFENSNVVQMLMNKEPAIKVSYMKRKDWLYTKYNELEKVLM